jgi:nudix-type nucleoside diphosphatase (YffH/AdpP family)
MNVPPQVLSTRSLHDGWTTLRLVRVRLDSGDVIEREVEDHGNAVAVLPFDPARRTALLVRILRAPALLSGGRIELLECPAGMIEEADPDETARRETYEEVGLRLRDLDHAGRVWTSPGVSTETMDLYLAPYHDGDRENAGGSVPAEHEHIEVVELSLDSLWSMVDRKQIEDLKTLALILTLRVHHPQLFGAGRR